MIKINIKNSNNIQNKSRTIIMQRMKLLSHLYIIKNSKINSSNKIHINNSIKNLLFKILIIKKQIIMIKLMKINYITNIKIRLIRTIIIIKIRNIIIMRPRILINIQMNHSTKNFHNILCISMSNRLHLNSRIRYYQIQKDNF
jgi:hypothetical protein